MLGEQRSCGHHQLCWAAGHPSLKDGPPELGKVQTLHLDLAVARDVLVADRVDKKMSVKTEEQMELELL